ncbi:hypothetical protein CRE_30427 [Caenorhabditis remanei]|uniref:Tyrosine-protein phosphatase domain-containing protein n=1 Tax=Caenorhabditis remanei TaxID=31234 RepID=E3NAH3_CAERE|nr:hypothetical protein CRE_30427 [Caenorhabditis remanei]
MLKRAIALVVVVLVNGSLAYEFNDRSGIHQSLLILVTMTILILRTLRPIFTRTLSNFIMVRMSHQDLFGILKCLLPDPSLLTQRPNPNPQDSLNLTHIRTVRNANDKLADYLKHTTIVAHLANGIAIQNGLMNGKIKPDELVGELLNFGSVAVPSIANFKKDSITALVEKLKEVKSNLDNSLENIENQALEWNKLIKGTSQTSNAKSLPGGKDFFTDVDKMSKDVSLNSLGAPAINIGKLESKLTTISKLNLATILQTKDASNAYREFQSLNDLLTSTIATIKDFKNSLVVLNRYKFLKDGPSTLEPVDILIQMIKQRTSLLSLTLDQATATSISNNIVKVVAMVTISQACEQDAQNINSLAASRAFPGSVTRKYTDGLPNGLADVNQLLKDVRDPWIGQILSINGSNLNGLADGLKPLFNLQKSLGVLDEQLKPISSESNKKALIDFKQIQSDLSSLQQDSSSSVSGLFTSLKKCGRTTPPGANTYAPSEKVIEKTRSLKKLFDNSNSALVGLDVEKVETDFKKQFESFGFKNFGGTTVNHASEIKTVLNKVKEVLPGFTKIINELKERFGGIPASITTEAKGILDNSATFNNFTDIDDELGVHNCLAPLKATSDKVSQAIRAIRKLKTMDLNKLADVVTVAQAVSQVATGLSGITSLPDTMKKDSSKVTTELNKLPDSLKNSEAIGQSVTSLYTASQLRGLETQIAQLKTIDVDVQAEIQKMLSPDDRKQVESQWGAHKKDMDELEKTLAEIKTFDTGIDVSKAKTLGAYGTPLEQLTSLSSSNIKAKEKSKALEVLLSQPSQPPIDPSTKSRLEATQKTLEQLSSLDLGFASHSAQYQSAPAAFQALHDFLSKFLAVDHQQTTIVTEEGGVSLVYIGIAVATILAGVAGSIWFYCGFWKPREEAKNFIKNNRLNNKKRAAIYHNKVHNAMNAFTKPPGKDFGTIGIRRHRHAIYCNPETQVKVKSFEHGIHANHVTTKSGKKYIATQAPMGNDIPGRVSTLADFWCMVLQYSSEFVVSLCSDEEMINTDGNGPKCGLYFAQEKGDEVIIENRFAVKTTSKQEILNNNVVKRIVKISDNTNEYPNHTLTHYQYITWPDHGVPTDHETGIALMDLVKKSKKHVVVHCSAGIGRTMSFIGMEYIYDEVLANPGIVWYDAMIKMRDARWHGIQTYVQSIWVLLAVFFKLIRKYKLKSKPYTEDLKIMKEINDDPAAAEAPEAAPAAAPVAAPVAAPAVAPRAPAAGEEAEGTDEEDEESENEPRNYVIIPIE